MIASYPKLDKETSKAVILAMKKRGAKFSKKLEKKIKKWSKKI